MSKYTLKHADVYITNVCNLTCTNCRSFNNFKFKGHREFDPVVWNQWSERLDLKRLSILGGEPTLHPDLYQWMEGLRRTFPNALMLLDTNGTHLSKVKGFHEKCAELDITVTINYHSEDLRWTISDEVFKAFGDLELITELPKTRNHHMLEFRSRLGVKILYRRQEMFQQAPFKDKNFQFHDSDPVKAFAACQTCIHFVDGKLYDCAVPPLMPEFLQQQNLPVPDDLLDYDPVTVDNVNQERLDRLMSGPIAQCKYCPENATRLPVISEFKGRRKIIKIVQESSY